MNPIVDFIMLVGFVVFILFIMTGYSRNRMHEVQDEENKKDK